MNPRFQPGGDKYESNREDDRRAFYERVEADRNEILSALKSQVRVYVEDELEMGNELNWRHFVDKYSEWNYESLYETIVDEIVKCAKEVVASGLSRAGEAI